MSRSAQITLDWADGTFLFALKWGQLAELQEKCDAGPYVVLGRLAEGSWRIGDISDTIRLGLIGGGMAPLDALKKVRTYVEDRPPLENVRHAQAILSAALLGAPDEQPGKPRAGSRRATRSRAAKSASPGSTEPAPPSA